MRQNYKKIVAQVLLTCIKLKLHFINTVPILSQTYNWNPLRKEIQLANRCKNNYGSNMDRDMVGIGGGLLPLQTQFLRKKYGRC